MERELGKMGARKLKARLKDLAAFENVAEIQFGRPHPLKGKYNGCLALDLAGGKRLVFESAHPTTPVTPSSETNWSEVTHVRVVFVGDYHD